MELDGTICQHTGILVNFWVNDMTLSSARSTLPPNINMNFIGVKKGEDGKEVEVILHRFSSGNALQDSIVNGGSWTNRNIGKWQQLMYTFSVPESLVGYENIIWKYKTTPFTLTVRTTPSMVCVSTAPSPRST